jgi:hypothetical protein
MAILFVIAAAVFIYFFRKRAQQDQEKNTGVSPGYGLDKDSMELEGKEEAAEVLNTEDINDQMDLISFDDAIEISLETVTSSDLKKATQYLGQYLKPEDLNTVWVVSDVIPELLVKENYAVVDPDEVVKEFKSYLRNLPEMEQVFNEFPTSRKEMEETGDLIDDLAIRYLDLKEYPEGELLLEQNPILTSMFADMRMTSMAFQQVLEGYQSAYWELREEFTKIRAAK